MNEFIPLGVSKTKIETFKMQRESEIKQAIVDEKIRRAETILVRYNSPFMGLGHIIVQKTEECGGDYRVLLAIAGNESGFGRIPYLKYNPFGYLDGVTYSGWEEALSVLSCRIAQQYLVPCNSDPACIVDNYGGPDTDKTKWIYNINWFANQV